MKICMIVAMSKNRGIGIGGKLPWISHPLDMAIFKKKTKYDGGVVVMGRKTYMSLPEKNRPLPDRKNVVLTRDKNFKAENILICHSKEEVLEKLKNEKQIWIIGGGEIYYEFLPLSSEVHISYMNLELDDADTYFPKMGRKEWHHSQSQIFNPACGAVSFTHVVKVRR